MQQKKFVSPKLLWKDYQIKLKFKWSCLKQKGQAAFTPNNVVSSFIVYELDSLSRDLNTDFTFGGWLFGDVKLTKYYDPDKYSNICYGVGFDTQIEYSLPDGSLGKNVIVFEADMSLSVNIENQGIGIWFLVKIQIIL